MAIQRLTADLNNHQSLSDRPNVNDGMTAAQLKQLFDKAPNDIKDFLNNILIPALESTASGSSGADNIGATEIAGLTGATVQALLNSIKTYIDTYKASNDAEVALKATIAQAQDLQSQITSNDVDISELQNGLLIHLHDGRYYTKEELVPFLRGGDTVIKEEVYTIVTADNGDSTFTYSDGANNYVGSLTPEGYQVLELRNGSYTLNMNRIEIFVGDTLRRSVNSGGLLEIDEHSVALTQPEGAGAEITIKYYERVGMAAEYNIKLSATKPPANNGQNMWFEVLG